MNQYIDSESGELQSRIRCHIILIENVAEAKDKTLEEWRYVLNPNRAPFERMEHVSRPVIYGIDLDAPPEQANAFAPLGRAVYKLTLQDDAKTVFYGLEMKELPFLRGQKYDKTPLPIPLGGQLFLEKGTKISHGMVQLEPEFCRYIGGTLELSERLNQDVAGKYVKLLERQMAEIKLQAPLLASGAA